MSDLIERLEKATGPDRELDAEICRAVGHSVETDRHFAEPLYATSSARGAWFKVPRYTGDISDAATLLKEGAAVELCWWPGEPARAVVIETAWREFGDRRNPQMAWVHSRADGDRRIEAIAATPAIALCIARLKASA